MKIEKVNENQIRCTLTREDLADRQLKLSELAYGTEKAKTLFRDMMQQAAYECGFEAEDIPLMIEAIPLSADTIILIITKVEYPEEPIPVFHSLRRVIPKMMLRMNMLERKVRGLLNRQGQMIFWTWFVNCSNRAEVQNLRTYR